MIAEMQVRKLERQISRVRVLEDNSDLLVEDRFGRPLPRLTPMAYMATERVSNRVETLLSEGASITCPRARSIFRAYGQYASYARTTNGASVWGHVIGLVGTGVIGGICSYAANIMTKTTGDNIAKAIGIAAGILLYLITAKMAEIEFCNNLPRIAADIRTSMHEIMRGRIRVVKPE
jgi:hypothetical protein